MRIRPKLIALVTMLLVVLPVLGEEDGFLYFGVGGGIQSYPSTLDPYGLLNKIPVIYPIMCFDANVVRRFHVIAVVSRTIYDANLWGSFSTQTLELNTIACGVAYDITTGMRRIACSVHLLTGFSTYESSVFEKSSSSGHGVRFGVSAHQPLYRDVVWSVATSVQRLHLQPLAGLDALNLDGFSVEFLVSLSL